MRRGPFLFLSRRDKRFCFPYRAAVADNSRAHNIMAPAIIFLGFFFVLLCSRRLFCQVLDVDQQGWRLGTYADCFHNVDNELSCIFSRGYPRVIPVSVHDRCAFRRDHIRFYSSTYRRIFSNGRVCMCPRVLISKTALSINLHKRVLCTVLDR